MITFVYRDGFLGLKDLSMVSHGPNPKILDLEKKLKGTDFLIPPILIKSNWRTLILFWIVYCAFSLKLIFRSKSPFSPRPKNSKIQESSLKMIALLVNRIYRKSSLVPDIGKVAIEGCFIKSLWSCRRSTHRGRTSLTLWVWVYYAFKLLFGSFLSVK